MPQNTEGMKIQRLTQIADGLNRLHKSVQALNSNMVTMYREDVARLEKQNEFKPINPYDLKPRYEVGMQVVVYCETSVRDGWRGTIVELSAMSAKVEFVDGVMMHLGGTDMIPVKEHPFKIDQHVVISEPKSAFYQKVGVIIGIKPDHLRVMFEGIAGYSIFTFEEVTIIPPIEIDEFAHVTQEDVEKIKTPDPTLTIHFPDDQGRLYPPQWRHNLGMDKFIPSETGHEPNENHLMTEEAFRIYNAGLYETGTTQGEHTKGDF